MLQLDTELLNSLREDLAVAGIPNKRELSASSGYPVKISSIEVQGQDFTENMMDIDSISIDPMEIDDEELPISEYTRYGYESDQDLIKSFRELPSTPIVRVTQRIERYQPLLTISSDHSYPDDEEKSSEFGGSMIVLDPVFHNQEQSLAFGDDERLAEQVRLEAARYE